MSKWEKDANIVGTLWTQQRFCDIINAGYGLKNIEKNRGVIMDALITSIEPQNFLFAQLHQLLGTGNDVKNTIQLIADEGFEQWSQVLIELYEEFIETEARERHIK